MTEPTGHSRSVRLWLDGAKALPSNESVCVAFEATFNALWRRAFVALGEITLGAVVERVRFNAAERWPLLEALRADRDGMHCQDLIKAAASLDRAQLADGLASIMVEFLTVLGNLTAQILTPALQAELARATRELADGAVDASARPPPKRSEDEGSDS